MSSLREQQRLETHRRLYEAALEVYRKDGLLQARIEDIASAAGVSRAAFYFHFPTKEHVLLERMWETEEEILRDVHALPDDTAFPEVLRTVTDRMAAIWEADPSLLPELAGSALRYTAEHMADREATRLRSELAERFAAASERGEVVVHLPPEILGDLYLANLLGGLMAWYGNPVMDLAGVLDGVSWLFWNGAKGA